MARWLLLQRPQPQRQWPRPRQRLEAAEVAIVDVVVVVGCFGVVAAVAEVAAAAALEIELGLVELWWLQFGAMKDLLVGLTELNDLLGLAVELDQVDVVVGAAETGAPVAVVVIVADYSLAGVESARTVMQWPPQLPQCELIVENPSVSAVGWWPGADSVELAAAELVHSFGCLHLNCCCWWLLLLLWLVVQLT